MSITSSKPATISKTLQLVITRPAGRTVQYPSWPRNSSYRSSPSTGTNATSTVLARPRDHLLGVHAPVHVALYSVCLPSDVLQVLDAEALEPNRRVAAAPGRPAGVRGHSLVVGEPPNSSRNALPPRPAWGEEEII
jgi:hypothetical protein